MPNRSAPTPLVDFGAIHPEVKRCEIMKACESVNESEASLIDEQVNFQFSEACGPMERLKAWASTEWQEQLWGEFLAQNYFDIVLYVIAKQRKKETTVGEKQIAAHQSILKSSRSKMKENTHAYQT